MSTATAAPPALPGFVTSTQAIIRLTLLRTWRGRKLRVAGVAAALIVAFPGVVALASEDAEATEVVAQGIDWGFFRLLVFLLPLLFTSGVVAEESDARTLHFLAMRPIQRAGIALGKYLVGTGAALLVLWSAFVLLHVVGYATEPTQMIEQIETTARAAGAASLLLVTYCAVTLFWGILVPDAAGMLAVVWLGFVEWFCMLLPSGARFISMSHFARELGGLERAGWDPVTIMGEVWATVPEVPLYYCALIIAGEWLVFLGLALIIMQNAELRFGRA